MILLEIASRCPKLAPYGSSMVCVSTAGCGIPVDGIHHRMDNHQRAPLMCGVHHKMDHHQRRVYRALHGLQPCAAVRIVMDAIHGRTAPAAVGLIFPTTGFFRCSRTGQASSRRDPPSVGPMAWPGLHPLPSTKVANACECVDGDEISKFLISSSSCS